MPFLPASNLKLANHPDSVSVNANFLSMRGKAIAYMYKTVPAIIAGNRLHPHDPTVALEYFLHTQNTHDGNQWACTFRAVDVLEIYSEDELEFIRLMQEQQIKDGILVIATKAEIEVLEGTHYILGQSLSQRGRL